MWLLPTISRLFLVRVTWLMDCTLSHILWMCSCCVNGRIQHGVWLSSEHSEHFLFITCPDQSHLLTVRTQTNQLTHCSLTATFVFYSQTFDDHHEVWSTWYSVKSMPTTEDKIIWLVKCVCVSFCHCRDCAFTEGVFHFPVLFFTWCFFGECDCIRSASTLGGNGKEWSSSLSESFSQQHLHVSVSDALLSSTYPTKGDLPHTLVCQSFRWYFNKECFPPSVLV